MEKYLSVKDVMDYLGLGRSTVYAMFQIPGFPATRVGRRLIVSERALSEWLARGGTEPKETAAGA